MSNMVQNISEHECLNTERMHALELEMKWRNDSEHGLFDMRCESHSHCLKALQYGSTGQGRHAPHSISQNIYYHSEQSSFMLACACCHNDINLISLSRYLAEVVLYSGTHRLFARLCPEHSSNTASQTYIGVLGAIANLGSGIRDPKIRTSLPISRRFLTRPLGSLNVYWDSRIPLWLTAGGSVLNDAKCVSRFYLDVLVIDCRVIIRN